MKNRYLVGLLGCVGVFLVYSITVINLFDTSSGSFWIPYLGTLVSFGILAYVMYEVFGRDNKLKSRVFGLPLLQVGIIFAAIQLVVGIILMMLAKVCPTWVSVVIPLAIISISLIDLFMAMTARETIEQVDVELEAKTAMIDYLRMRCNALVGKCKSIEARTLVARVAERLKYADPVSGDQTVLVEEKLSDTLGLLEQLVAAETQDTVAIAAVCTQMNELLDERAEWCKLSKRSM